MTNEAKWYGVSSGDGNYGVSHLFADYYVKTSEPYRLAELATLTLFKPEAIDWAKENMQIDGEAEYTISAVIHETIETQEERQEIRDRAEAAREAGEHDEADALENEADEYGTDYAAMIIEVFPCEPDDQREGRPTYESLEECFGEDCNLVDPETVCRFAALANLASVTKRQAL